MKEGSPPNVKDYVGAVAPRQRVHLGTNLSFRPLLLEASELHLAFNETEAQVNIIFIKRYLDIASLINCLQWG